jgi:hypothetical protein
MVGTKDRYLYEPLKVEFKDVFLARDREMPINQLRWKLQPLLRRHVRRKDGLARIL